MSPMVLIKPTPQSGGQFTDRFKLTRPKHMIRVFAFTHAGKEHLAAVSLMHFVENQPQPCTGKDCVLCAESKQTGNKRLRRVTRYPMLVVDVEADAEKVLRFDAPSSVYKAIYGILEGEDPADFIGNDGVDFVVKTNKGAQPQDVYQVQPRMKGSEKLDIDVSALPDLVDEVARDNSPTTGTFDTAALDAESDTREKVSFKNARGKAVTGFDTGTRKGKKLVIEADGQLYTVDPKDVIED